MGNARKTCWGKFSYKANKTLSHWGEEGNNEGKHLCFCFMPHIFILLHHNPDLIMSVTWIKRRWKCFLLHQQKPAWKITAKAASQLRGSCRSMLFCSTQQNCMDLQRVRFWPPQICDWSDLYLKQLACEPIILLSNAITCMWMGKETIAASASGPLRLLLGSCELYKDVTRIEGTWGWVW